MTDDITTPESAAPTTEPVAAPAEPEAHATSEVPSETPTEPFAESVTHADVTTDVSTTPEADATVDISPASEPTPAAPATEPDPPATPKKPRKPKAAPVAVESEAPSGEPAPVAEATTTEAVAPFDVATAPVEGDPVPAAPAEPENKKRWYAVKIQSGREESIKAAVERKVKIEGLEQYFGQIVIPVEELIVKKKVRVKNKKTGETTTQEKNVTKYNKKFPGYLFAEVEFNNEILYVFRETSGVGDFVGVNTKKTQGAVERSAPAPMTEDEVKSMLTGAPSEKGKKGPRGKVVVKLDVEKGDKVRIKNGAFAGNEGEVKAIIEAKDPTDTPKVTVEVTIWGRPVPIDLDYWEVDKV